VTAGTNCGNRFKTVSTPTALVSSKSVFDRLDRAVRREVLSHDARARDDDFLEHVIVLLILRDDRADRHDRQRRG
jgi:hypothetical protein